jgi:DNA-binding CsgD family transcriptional regulator
MKRAGTIDCLVIICCLLVSHAGVRAQQQRPYAIFNFSKEQYRGESQNWSVTKDQNGFIYGANNAGLTEFDGVDWNFYPAPNGTVIRSVAVGENNIVFTGGYREIGFWERDLFGELSYHSLNEKAAPLFSQNEEFWNTVIIGPWVYFHSFSSIFIYDHDEFRVVRPGILVNSISRVNGKLMVHLAGRGLFVLEDTLLTPFLLEPFLPNDIIHFCIPFQDSGLLIGTGSNGLFLYRDNRLVPFLEPWKEFFAENKINRGIIDSSGRIIIGTLLEGICIFDTQGRLLHRISTAEGLQNNTVLGIFSDEDDNIWVALDKGMDFISFSVDPSFTLYEYEEIGAVYSAVIYRGELYLCTNQGVFFRPWENEEEPFTIVPGTQGQAWSGDVFDDQLIISHNAGTFRIEDHRAIRISNISGGFGIIRNPAKAGQLIQSTYSNIVFYDRPQGSWQYAYQLPEFFDLIRYIQIDHLNNLWASHMHRGVYRLRLNDLQDSILAVDYSGDSVFGKDFGIQVFKIENRIVFTTGQMFYTYNGLTDSIEPYRLLNSRLGEFAEAHRVVAGPDHHYWFISRSGLALFRILDTEITKIKEYPRGLFHDHLIAGYENIYPLSVTEGILCLDNGYAILRADQSDLSHVIEDRHLTLKGIEISGRSGQKQKLPLQQEPIRIPFSRNSLTLGFAFPLISREPLAFQSYVEGLDNTWSEPLDNPVFHFTRIPSGEYTIRVRAYNEWGRSSLEDQIILQVTPPWYRSGVTIILYALLLLFFLLGGRYWLVRRIRERERKIREAKEKELIKLRNEKLNAELSFKSQELANSTMAIIKKNEFLMELKETIKHQKEDLGTRFPEKYYTRLVKKIDHNISSMDDWKVFEFHFEKAHEQFLQKLKTKYPQLSHSDLRLCAYLRMNLSSKEIAPLLRISYRGVENHRYRLRKKLLLKNEVNLTDFILSI